MSTRFYSSDDSKRKSCDFMSKDLNRMPNGVFIPNVKGFLPQTALHRKYLEKYCSLLQVPLQQPDSYFTQKLHWIARSQTYAYKRQCHKKCFRSFCTLWAADCIKKTSAYMQFFVCFCIIIFKPLTYTSLLPCQRRLLHIMWEVCNICARALLLPPPSRLHAHMRTLQNECLTFRAHGNTS